MYNFWIFQKIIKNDYKVKNGARKKKIELKIFEL